MATFEVVENVGNDLWCKCTDPSLLLPRAKVSVWRDGKLVTIGVFTLVILAVEGIQVHGNEGGVTLTRGGIYWLILPAGYLGSSFWVMVFILASTNLLAAMITAGCLIISLLIVLFIAKNWTLRFLCVGFIIFVAVVWVLQELTKVHILCYIILVPGSPGCICLRQDGVHLSRQRD